MRWWLISDEDVNQIRAALESSSHDANGHNCPAPNTYKGCGGCDGQEMRRTGLHALASGLHQTEHKPTDFGGVEPA